MEADEPFAGGAVAADFGGSELPTAGGLQGEIGEILAWAGRIERGIGDVAGGIDVNADGDANDSMNGGEGFRRGVGQNLVEDFTALGRRCGSARRVCRTRQRVGARGSRGWRGYRRSLGLRRGLFPGGSFQRVLRRGRGGLFWSWGGFTARRLFGRIWLRRGRSRSC